MTDHEALEEIASGLALSVSLLRRRLRQRPVEGVDGMPTLPELAALVRLDRSGPATNADLAKAEQISPQAMSATLGGLEQRGLIGRTADPADGRRILLAVTDAGQRMIAAKRAVRTEQLAGALVHLDADEIATLRAAVPALERLAEHL
ncbi:MarR family transcriptional regulator [Nocardioides sp. BP30]|uniref:MarR family winged helix-turn-helix transcriptional regulator n=1 Tax=Nocardioides sp. BP30 TaxID=3036374 RepID=UPI002468A6DD|nr:MarR family transcriptional regulator [Nocardioides sp. BP30]WGL51585.1 MarR family transcriptional regulator [Nocardioides sp. BP30]